MVSRPNSPPWDDHARIVRTSNFGKQSEQLSWLLKELKVRARSFFPKRNQDRPKGIIRVEIGVLSMIPVLADAHNKDLDFIWHC
jgi:hypothetical protein